MANKKASNYTELNRQLDDIVLKLQDERTSIDESLELYAKGMEIITELEQYLKTAENTIKKIRAKAK